MEKWSKFFLGVSKVLHSTIPLGSFILFAILDIYVIRKQLLDFPTDGLDLAFYNIVSFAVVFINIYQLMEFKKHLKNLNIEWSIAYGLSYLFVLSVFFIASMGFNLKVIEKSSQNGNFDNMAYSAIISKISKNETAIEKYNNVIEGTNDTETIFSMRNLITKLQATNDILYSNAQVINTTNKTSPLNSFDLFQKNIGIKANTIKFWFLSGLWFILCLGMFMTAPPSKEAVKKQTEISFSEETSLEFIFHRWEIFVKWIQNICIKDNYADLYNDNMMFKNFGINRGFSKKFREILGEISAVDGEKRTPLLKNGKLNFAPDKIVKAIKNQMEKQHESNGEEIN